MEDFLVLCFHWCLDVRYTLTMNSSEMSELFCSTIFLRISPSTFISCGQQASIGRVLASGWVAKWWIEVFTRQACLANKR